MSTLTPTRGPIVTNLKITAKGQVTLRKELLESLGVGPGDTIRVTTTPEGNAVIHPKRKTGSWEDLHGIFNGMTDIHLTIDEMNDIIAKGWAGELEDDE